VPNPVERGEGIVTFEGCELEHGELIDECSQAFKLKFLCRLAALQNKQSCLLVLFLIIAQPEVDLLQSLSEVIYVELVNHLPLREELGKLFSTLILLSRRENRAKVYFLLGNSTLFGSRVSHDEIKLVGRIEVQTPEVAILGVTMPQVDQLKAVLG